MPLLLLLLALLQGVAVALQLAINSHVGPCNLSHPYGALQEWAVEVKIGTPPRIFHLQLDSGFHAMSLSTSDALYLPCPEIPMQTYHMDASSTSKVYTCAEAKVDGVTKCFNCKGPRANSSDACVSHTGIFGPAVNYTWVSETVSIDGVTLPNFHIALFNDSTYQGSWGFKVDDKDPSAPPWSSMMRDLQQQGAISELSYSMCFNATIGFGMVSFGDVIPYAINPTSAPVKTEEPVVMIKGLVSAVSIGSSTIYKSNTSNPPMLMNVDTGTLGTRIPHDWAKRMMAQLEENCSSNPLVGVCIDSTGQPLSRGSKHSILRGQCYSLTTDQRQAYPDIDFTLPAANSTMPPYQFKYTHNEYLSRFSSPCTRKILNLKNCEGVNDVIVVWAFMDMVIPNDDTGELIIGQDLYNSYLHYHNYEHGWKGENTTLGLARISMCTAGDS
eukprot:UC4_evm4s1151